MVAGSRQAEKGVPTMSIGRRVRPMLVTAAILPALATGTPLWATRASSPQARHAEVRSCSWGVVDSTWRAFLHDVFAISPTDIWAVGGLLGDTQTFAEHWDGSTWTVVATPTPGGGNENPLLSVSAAASDDVWAVGFQHADVRDIPLVEHWDGSTWSIVSVPTPPVLDSHLNGVSVVSSSDVWAVGYLEDTAGRQSRPLAEHWDGAAWAPVPVPWKRVGASVRMQSVAALSSDDVWAVGAVMSDEVPDQTVRMHWDGLRWRSVRGPKDQAAGTTLYDVAAVSASDVWAVGTTGAPHADYSARTEHWDGTRWSRIAAPNGPFDASSLLGTSASSSNDAWAVGLSFPQGGGGQASTLTEHWDGSQWSVIPSTDVDFYNAFLSVASLSPTDVWAVGSSGSTGNDGLIERYTC
jgi:hypothetical protein